MTRQYNEIIDTVTGEIIYWYEENGFRVSFPADPANSDYQAYLNKDKPQVKHLTEIVADETPTK